MKVTTEITKFDLIRFNLAMMPKMRSTYISLVVISCLAFAFIVWEKGLPQTSHGWQLLTLASVAGGFGGMFAGILISFIFILLSSSAQNGTLGKHEYEIRQDGLFEKTIANEGLSKWEGVQEVKASGGYLLYKVSGYLFHIIPYRSFSSKDDREQFQKMSMEYWKHAHNK